MGGDLSSQTKIKVEEQHHKEAAASTLALQPAVEIAWPEQAKYPRVLSGEATFARAEQSPPCGTSAHGRNVQQSALSFSQPLSPLSFRGQPVSKQPPRPIQSSFQAYSFNIADESYMPSSPMAVTRGQFGAISPEPAGEVSSPKSKRVKEYKINNRKVQQIRNQVSQKKSLRGAGLRTYTKPSKASLQ